MLPTIERIVLALRVGVTPDQLAARCHVQPDDVLDALRKNHLAWDGGKVVHNAGHGPGTLGFGCAHITEIELKVDALKRVLM